VWAPMPWQLDLRIRANTLINETNMKYEATTLSISEIAIQLEEPHKLSASHSLPTVEI